MRRLLLLVGAIVLVDLMFYAAIVPLLPWYVQRFGLSETGAGVLAGSYAAGTLLGALPSGWVATRIGNRRTVIVGLAGIAVSSVGFAFGTSVEMLVAMRFLQGLGSACTWSGGLGWLLSAAAPEDRGKTIGKALSAALMGLLLGPALGALARELGPEAPFTAVAVLSAGLIVVALRAPAAPPTLRSSRPLRTALADRVIRLGMLLVFVPALVFGAVEVLTPLQLNRLGATSVAIAATFVAASAIEMVVQPYAGRATDRHGRLWPLRIGFAGSLAFMLLLPLPQAAPALSVMIAIGCVVTGALNTPAMALLSEGVAGARIDQGFGFALVNLMWAGGQVVGTVAGGALAGATSDTVVYLVLAGACAATLAAILGPAGALAVGRRGAVPQPAARA